MKKEQTEGLDIAGLLALKTYEHPDAERIEKNVQSTLQAVRAAHKRPTLHFFPDKSAAWMFAQPRYGIAALFVVFLGLHLVKQPMPAETVGTAAVQEPRVEMELLVATNRAPVAIPVLPTARRPGYSPSLVQPVSNPD